MIVGMMSRAKRRRAIASGSLVALGLVALLLGAAVIPQPVRGAEPDDEEDDGDENLLARLGFTIETDIEFAIEDQGDETTSEITFDEVGVAVEGEWWQAEAGIKYDSEGNRGLIIEEGAVQLGGTEQWPWFVQAGRTIVPFGEYDSRFVEDPLVTAVGETDGDAVIFGFDNESIQVPIGVFTGEVADDGDIDFVASVKIGALDRMTFGISWSSDVHESEELQEIHQDLLEETGSEEGSAEGEDSVDGFGFFVSLEMDKLAVQLEYVSALESFAPGFLDEEELDPSAWNLEVAVSPGERWELASRLEASYDLPDNPDWQYGLAASYRLAEYATVSGDYLRGDFDDEPDRNLASIQLTLEYGY
jgi:hypothetical protein